jgi:hypothetical protein
MAPCGYEGGPACGALSSGPAAFCTHLPAFTSLPICRCGRAPHSRRSRSSRHIPASQTFSSSGTGDSVPSRGMIPRAYATSDGGKTWIRSSLPALPDDLVGFVSVNAAAFSKGGSRSISPPSSAEPPIVGHSTCRSTSMRAPPANPRSFFGGRDSRRVADLVGADLRHFVERAARLAANEF